MKELNALHIEIATVLIECAKNKTTISYSDLCEEVGYPSPRAIGKELEKVSLLTYEKYGICLSVLVVRKGTKNSGTPLPSDGFTKMFAVNCGSIDNMEATIKEQQEKAYAQDWSELPEILRNKIKEQNLVKA